jgi:hypothetical protein
VPRPHRPYVVLLGGAALVAACLAGVGSATAAVSAPAASWPAGVTRPAAASSPRGQTLIAPTSGWTDARGVAHLTYRADPGLVANVPPRGLSPGRVTSALAVDLGLRAGRPGSSPAAQRRLVQLVRLLARNRTAPEFCRSRARPDEAAGIRSRPRKKDPVNDHFYTTNWGGYVKSEAGNGSGINAVNGAWSVPRSLTKSAPSVESTWTGIGGAGFEGSKVWGLIQAGTEMQTDWGFRTFWEYIGSSGCVKKFCGKYSSVDAVRPGDSVEVEVTWNTTRTACFYFLDRSRSSASFSLCHAVNIPYDHTSAEWITEFPAGFKYYDSPGTVSWSDEIINNGFAGSGSWHSPFSGSFWAYILAPYGGKPPIDCGDGLVASFPVKGKTASNGDGSSQNLTCQINGFDYP